MTLTRLGFSYYLVFGFCSCNNLSRSLYFFSVILVTDLTNLKQIVLEKKKKKTRVGWSEKKKSLEKKKKNWSWLVGEEEVVGKKKKTRVGWSEKKKSLKKKKKKTGVGWSEKKKSLKKKKKKNQSLLVGEEVTGKKKIWKGREKKKIFGKEKKTLLYSFKV